MRAEERRLVVVLEVGGRAAMIAPETRWAVWFGASALLTFMVVFGLALLLA